LPCALHRAPFLVRYRYGFLGSGATVAAEGSGFGALEDFSGEGV